MSKVITANDLVLASNKTCSGAFVLVDVYMLARYRGDGEMSERVVSQVVTATRIGEDKVSIVCVTHTRSAYETHSEDMSIGNIGNNGNALRRMLRESFAMFADEADTQEISFDNDVIEVGNLLADEVAKLLKEDLS